MLWKCSEYALEDWACPPSGVVPLQVSLSLIAFGDRCAAFQATHAGECEGGCSKRPAVRCWRPLLGRSRATPQTPGPHERDRPARLSRLCTSQGSAWIYMHKPAQRRPTASLGPGLRTYPRCAPALHTGGRLRPDALRLPQPAPMKVRAGTAGAPELASVPDLSVAEETERARRAWHSTWPALFAPLLHSPALRAALRRPRPGDAGSQPWRARVLHTIRTTGARCKALS